MVCSHLTACVFSVCFLPQHQSLDALVRSKELELEQAAEAYRNLQWLRQKSEEEERNTLREKEALIKQLQAALQARSHEMQVPHAHHKPVFPVSV